jgi:membrane fusion protein, multidrug efflux system
MSPDTAQPVPSVPPDTVAPKPAVAREGEKPPDVAAPASPPAPPLEAAPAPAPPPAPQASPPLSGLARSRLRRVLTVGGTLLFLFILWETVTYFVAYTDDAYVRSDLVAVAPEITGPVIAVHVVDNQTVKKGDPLLTIDPVPFQLDVNQRQAQIDEAAALLKVSKEQLTTAKAALDSATSAHTYAAQEQARFADLARTSYAPRAELDKWNDELRRSEAEMTISQVAILKAQTNIAAQQAALDLAKADMATAQWRLSKTQIVAPTDGAITNLTVRVGDTGTVNIPMIGIVDANAWRIMANYKQYYVRSFKVGGEAWVWLDSSPWHFHRAKITGIARGFSRDPQAPMLLPYVAPTTDWIRLQRRIPVTIVLVDPPPDGLLFSGADARTIIFPR